MGGNEGGREGSKLVCVYTNSVGMLATVGSETRNTDGNKW